MPELNDLSRSRVALDQDRTIIAVIEMSQSSWLVAGVLPGIERQPRKKLEPSAERLSAGPPLITAPVGSAGRAGRTARRATAAPARDVPIAGAHLRETARAGRRPRSSSDGDKSIYL
jgi:hypothetical protein